MLAFNKARICVVLTGLWAVGALVPAADGSSYLWPERYTGWLLAGTALIWIAVYGAAWALSARAVKLTGGATQALSSTPVRDLPRFRRWAVYVGLVAIVVAIYSLKLLLRW